ncbi:MAG TPA: hypothetical protein RMH85_29450 [Polyangiaceae bacterium LLY-WYZ-15_(1-7)]|nr:hypothetical protein [Sandaracinus sp.]HJL06835.1 hypothetical protein [Polyangiaceae bacterium LLY-WYZ-15_(1-7)]HJL12643.1 hypothetical protein [Polyangiaceae bacterium LLY-WYZ-15_(1-7)]
MALARSVPLVVLLLLGGALPDAARAHGRFPEAHQLVLHPTDDAILGVATTFGLVLTDDGGASWRWVCRPVMGVQLTEDPPFRMLADGTILGATFDGLSVGEPGGCAWAFAGEPLEGSVVIDAALAPDDPTVAYALTSDGGAENGVFRSDDGGASWAPTGPPVGAILFERIRVAPSDPERIYLSGVRPATVAEPERAGFVHRSEDGGASWEELPFALGDGERNVLLLGVDPADPDTLYARTVPQRERTDVPERLIRSQDGGATWETVLEVGEVTGLTFLGGVLHVGARPSPADGRGGLWRAGEAGLEPIRDDLAIGCLEARGGELWACAQNWADGFALGRSADGGATFEPVLRFDEMIGPVICPAGAEIEAACEVADEDIERDLLFADCGGYGDGGVPLDGATCEDGGAGADAGSGGGGGCAAGGGGGAGGGAGTAALALFGLATLGRRRRV